MNLCRILGVLFTKHNGFLPINAVTNGGLSKTKNQRHNRTQKMYFSISIRNTQLIRFAKVN